MKAPAFDYLRPSSLDDAIKLLGAHPDAKLIAGGQSLLASLNLRLSQPSHLIDIGRLAELRGISVNGGVLRGRYYGKYANGEAIVKGAANAI